MKKLGVFLIVLSLVALGFSIYFGSEAHDKYNNYYNSEYALITTNAYVGGDAYNYIINGTYFTAFSVLAGFSGFLGVSLLVFGVYLLIKYRTIAPVNTESLPTDLPRPLVLQSTGPQPAESELPNHAEAPLSQPDAGAAPEEEIPTA